MFYHTLKGMVCLGFLDDPKLKTCYKILLYSKECGFQFMGIMKQIEGHPRKYILIFSKNDYYCWKDKKKDL